MRTLVCLMCVLVARTASAEPEPWSIQLPPHWSDITADTAIQPPLMALKQRISELGGTFELRAYASGDGPRVVGVISDFAKMPTETRQLVGFENAARERAYKGGTEVSYQEDRTETTVYSTQRVGGKQLPLASRRFTGFLKEGGMRSVSVICYGDPAVCDPLLATVSVDPSAFRPLATIDEGGSSIAYRLGLFAGSVLIVIVIVAAFWRRR